MFLEPGQPGTGEQEWTPPVPKPDGADWVKLKSGEWIRGRIGVLDHRDLEFDSDELGDLELTWANVVELRSPKANSIMLGDGSVIHGTILIRDGVVIIGTPEGERRITREDLIRISPGVVEGWSENWTGRVSLLASVRSGNTNETDVTTIISARRRLARSRVSLDYRADFSQLQGVDTADTHRFRGRFDYFATSRFFLTLMSLELFREPFENIRYRVTPAVGVGYTVVDSHMTLWDLGLGVGYQGTRFDSVPAGSDERSAISVLILGTALETELTKWLEFEFGYTLQLVLEDTSASNHFITSRLSFDVVKDFDVDIVLSWDRQGNVAPDENGFVPDADSFLLTVGVGWKF